MNQVFYLESDEEITAVIDRIRKSDKDGVVLVIPRNSTLSQSIVNFKLLKRSAAEKKKSIFLVTGEKTTQNLANQVKIPFFDKVKEAENATAENTEYRIQDTENSKQNSDDQEEDFKVNTYKRYSLSELNDEKERENQAEIDEPSTLLDKASALPIAAELSPISEDFPDDRDAEKFEKKRLDLEIEKYEQTQATDQDQSEHVLEKSSEPRKIQIEHLDDENDQNIGKDNKVKQIKAGGSRKFLLVFFSIVALAILATAVITLPKATATLNVAASDFKKDYTVTAQKSTSLSIDKKMIPATVVEVDKESTKSYPATGTQDAGTKATGKVTITNKYSSSAVFIAQGTILTSAGQNFVLSAAVTVPGDAVTLVNGSIVETPGTVDASVTAQATGEAGNLAPSTFSVAKYSSKLLYATSTVAFTGGTTKTLHLVTDDDLANAQIALQKDITTAGATDVTAKANQGSLKIDTSKIDSEILSVTPNQKAGDQVDTFTLDMRLSLFAVGFVEKDLQSLTLSLAKADIGPNKMLLNADQNQVTYSVTDTDVNNGIIKITSTFTGKTGSKLDLDQIKDKITAKSKSSALKYLQSVDGIKSANLTVWPSFLKMTPVLGSRIKVNFDYTK